MVMPAEPLNSMWVAVTRQNYAGNVMRPQERVSQQQALEAITINAAHTIGLADITGSLRAGKRADFTVLNQDPLTCEPDELRDIEIAATVFEGRVFLSQSSQAPSSHIKPITIIGGYLGAGKTTLINRLPTSLSYPQARRCWSTILATSTLMSR